PICRRGEVGSIVRFDATGRLEDALQKIFAGPKLSNRGQVRSELRTSIAKLVAATALERGRPKKLLPSADVTRERQNGPGPRIRAELAFPLRVQGEVAFQQIANRTAG